MARAESKMIMGYLPIEQHHHAAILSLLHPATPATRMLDPFAGDGFFLEVAAKAWNVTPYANELDGERAAACTARFGPIQAIRCDAERLLASNDAFGVLWVNPPYDHDKTERNSKRVEFAYLRHSWKWAQEGAPILWCIYQHHITEEAAAFLSKHSRSVDVWALPGKHLGEYDQVIVVAVKGTNEDPAKLYEQILAGKAAPRLLTVQEEPLYRVPQPPDAARKFSFAPDMVDEEQGLRLIQQGGAWKSHAFQALLEMPRPVEEITPIVPPRPGHLALVLAAGVANGAVIPTDQYGMVAVRGKTYSVEKIAHVEVEQSPDDPTKQIKKTTTRIKPTTVLSLLAQDGSQVEMNGDDALLDFIGSNKAALAAYLNRRFRPIYQFDFNGLRAWLDRIRLKGKYTLYTAQKHVIGALTQGFEHRKGILLVGQMGTGKTAMGGSAAIAIASAAVQALRTQMRPDQVVLIVAPPHLVEKWKRELISINENIFVERLDNHEDVKAFMDKAARLGPGIAKIGLIKRDMTKLGAARETSVVWVNHYAPRWKYGQEPPEGQQPHQRLQKMRIPTCPHCGQTIAVKHKGHYETASESWLKSGKRECPICLTPLWQEARSGSAKPKEGEKYATKNPRYRIDEYLKRRYADRVYLLVWDEAHECQHGDTGNGEAFSRMAGLSQKVLAMTGTPFNGRASSLFNLEYALNPRLRERYPWGGARRLGRKVRGDKRLIALTGGMDDEASSRGRAEARWVEDMGVREQVIEERPAYDKETGAFTGTSTYERPYEEAPGISPLLIAEMLDHAIFFSLGDLGKWLPKYEEIAVPITPDADVASLYDSTRDKLKRYLVQRRWEGDTTFRGAYLQWSMGWPNATFRPYPIIHNLKNPVTKEKHAFKIQDLPSLGEDRIYAKEQHLIDLVRAELAENRPVVIFIRQTGTKDIQPRIEKLIQDNVSQAKTFILKNSVAADRREKVIEDQVAQGANVIISNPELVKTGLDLVFSPTLYFHEITFNLGTMMQAAGRSLRLNQTHALCKTYYPYLAGTMEETAVQLMSRKQRAAKLLNGDIGLSGLDALTEGEAGLEEALMNAIGREEALLNPAELFKSNAALSAIDQEDAAYWNVDVATSAPIQEVPAPVAVPIFAESLEGVGTPVGAAHGMAPLPLFSARQTGDVLLDMLEQSGAKIIAITHDTPTPSSKPHDSASLRRGGKRPGTLSGKRRESVMSLLAEQPWLDHCGAVAHSPTLNPVANSTPVPGAGAPTGSMPTTGARMPLPARRKTRRRKIDLSAAPVDKPISTLDLLARKPVIPVFVKPASTPLPPAATGETAATPPTPAQPSPLVPQVQTLPPPKPAPRRRKIDLSAAPVDKPIQTLDLLAHKGAAPAPARPTSLPVPPIPPAASPVQLSMF